MRRRVAPFGDPRIDGYLLLPEAFRSLSRPSSAPDAKAFPLRSFQLDLRRHKLCLGRRRLQPLGFRRRLPSLRCSAASPSKRFAGLKGDGDAVCLLAVSENSWFSLRIMQAFQRCSRNCITLHPFGCCSTIFKCYTSSRITASLLPYFTLLRIVQFSRCRLGGKAPLFLLFPFQTLRCFEMGTLQLLCSQI